MLPECECDVDFRCENHDLEAEEYEFLVGWRRRRRGRGVDQAGGYELDDPKHPDWFDRMLEMSEFGSEDAHV